MNLNKLSLALLSYGLLLPLGHADNSLNPSPVLQQDLATIVVTASASAQDIKTAPASISVITANELEGKPYSNLIDAVRSVEGVSMVGDSTNNKDISIRGLPGDYTLILIDGKRQGTRETMNYGNQGVQHHLIPPLNAIERIEIVRGPMSSLYGSDAMGGVINIITKKNPQQWSGSLNLNTIIQEDSKFGDHKLAEFWLGGPLSERLSMQVFGKYSDRDEDNYPEFGAFAFENQSIAAQLNAMLTDAQNIEIKVGKDEVNYEGSADKTYYYMDKHDRTHWALTHNGSWIWGTSKLSLHQEKEAYDNITAWSTAPTREITNTVVDALATIPFDSNTLNIGAQHIQAKLTGLGQESAVPGYINTDKASVDSTSFFAENESQLTDRLSVTQGLRLDNHSLYDDHISPRLYAVYLLNDEVTLRGGIATGFKAPTLRQSTTNYCMLTGSNTGRGTLCGNASLKPETST
jgi:outer membrane receptor for ferrienterochelin and colicins